MADINDDTAESSDFEKRLSGLHGLTNKYAALMFVEQLLTFFVDLHSDYLEASYAPDEGKEKINNEFLKHVTAKAKGKIFVDNYDFAESQDTKDQSTVLEEIITLVNSRCHDKLGVQKGAKQKVSVETSDDQHFYKKLLCLLNSGKKDVSKKQKEYDCRIPTTDKSNAFFQSVYSLEQRVSGLEAMLEENEATHQEVVSKYENEGAEFRARIAALETNLGETEAILQDLTTDYCRLKDEIEKRKREAIFREVAQPNDSTSSDTEHQISTEESSARVEQSLANTPTNVIEQELHNNYKLLLLHISQSLLQDEIVKLKNWAASSYSVKTSDEVFDILAELDNKGIISSCNITVLRDFFEGITRIDLVVLIEHFLAGNYSFLRGVQSMKRENQGARRHSHPRAQERWLLNDAHLQNQAASGNSIQRTSVEEVLVTEKRECTHTRRDKQSLQIAADGPREQVIIAGSHKDTVIKYNIAKIHTDDPTFLQLLYFDQTGIILCPTHQVLKTTAGSNGNKLSKPECEPETREQRRENRQGNSNLSHEPYTGPWLCDHYKRRCLVKFDCCEKFWPCHRCHNSEGNCGQRKLKSRDIRLIKCVSCQREQPFQENSQFCSECGIKFAEYFCATCKHLTGRDDNPYHCDKCGICRIHGDRSFHCDVCGVCLDVQLKDNHKCRAGSAHDECCICLEDAFTGCQILPCSHKVHKECATQMIRSGITRCPICRESFAHKLDRYPPHRKHQGKKK